MRCAAGWLAVLTLAACRPAVPPGPFSCTRTEDCSAKWFCGLDKHCHDEAKGEPLSCREDLDCGGQWHCGAAGVCYDRADAGTGLACRRALGSADSGYRGGDCGPDFRCGVDGRCHPEADAGAIPCEYAADFADCTDGWRCSFAGVCLDPANEALEPFDAGGPLSPRRVRNLLPASGEAAVSESSAEGMAIATLDDAGLRLFRRALKPPLTAAPTEPEHFVTHELKVFSFAPGGVLSGPLAAGLDQVTFFRNGVLSRAFVDGGPIVLRAGDGGVLSLAGGGERRVSVLRPLPNGWLGAFDPGGAGYWTIGPDSGTAQWRDRPQIAELIELSPGPTIGGTGQVCYLEGTRDGGAGPIAFSTPAAGLISAAPPCDLLPGFEVAAWDDSRIRSANGVTAVAEPVELIASRPRVQALIFPQGYSSRTPFCLEPCGARGRVANFWPFADLPATPSAEVLCESTDAGDRWWTVVDVFDRPCLERAIDRRTAAFYSAHLTQAPGRTRAGSYARYQPNFRTGNGQAWAGSGQGQNTFANAEPWFLDRPPQVLAEIELRPGGARVVLSSGDHTSGVLTPEGFRASEEPIPFADGIKAERLLALSRQGELMVPLELRVVARVELVPFPQQAELHSIAVPRAEGGVSREWVVSVDDQLFAATARDDGRLVTLRLAARPAPGFELISLAARTVPQAPNKAEFLAATRQSVFRVFLDPLNRWRAEEVKLGTNSDFLEVWVTDANRARVADRSGAVYSLPSGLLLAAAPVDAGTAQDYLSACGRDFALFSKDAFVLGPAERGTGRWTPLGLAPDQFEGGRLFEGGGLLVFAAGGELQKIPCGN